MAMRTIAMTGYKGLGVGVIYQAIRELRGKDSLEALDAALWLFESGPSWCDECGYYPGPDGLLPWLAETFSARRRKRDESD